MQADRLAETADTDAGRPDVRSGGRRLSVRAGLVVGGLYLLAGLVPYWHLLPHLATHQPPGDEALFDWFVAWTPYALGHASNPFFTHVANYPFGVNLLDNGTTMALGLLMAPVTILFGPVASVNLLLILCFPASAGGAYLLARRFVAWRPAAFVAGLLFGFSPYMVGQGLGHIHLTFVAVPPLIFLVLHELFVRQEGSAVKWGAGLGLLIVAQFFISTEVLATTALFSAITLAVLAVAYPRSVLGKLRTAWPGVATAAAVSGALLAYPVYVAAAGPQSVRGVIPGFLVYYSSLVGPLLPSSMMQFGTAHMKALGDRIGGNVPENGTYLGLPLVLLLIVAPFVVRRRALRIAAVMAAIAFVISLGATFHFGLVRFSHLATGLKLPGWVISKIPKLNNSFPVRYSMYVVLFAAIVLAVAMEALRTGRWRTAEDPEPNDRPRDGGWRRALAPAALAVVVLLPLVPAWPYGRQSRLQVPAYFTTSAVNRLAPGTVTLVYPFPIATDPDPMIWQAEAGMRFQMLGGYFVLPAKSGSQYWTPTFTQETLTALLTGQRVDRTPELLARLRDQLSGWKTTAVLVRPVGPDPVSFFTWLVGRPPDDRAGGMIEWYHVHWG